MKALSLTKLAAATSLLFVCATGYTQAAVLGLGENFTFDGTSLGGGVVANIDAQNFRYSATIDQTQTGGTFLDGDDKFTESGWMSFTGFLDDAGNNMLGSGLGATFGMYALFQAEGTASLDGSGFGILANFTSFKLEFYIDDIGNTTFNSSNTSLFPVRGNTADDIKIATANLVEDSEAHVFGGLANGDYQVNMSDFGLELFGQSLFTDPDPFYKKFYFTGVTTKIGPEANLNNPFKTNLTGSGDLAYIPEPESISLLGIGMLAFGLASSRRRTQVQA